jgi:hypothetical protein
MASWPVIVPLKADELSILSVPVEAQRNGHAM